jgi:predicted cupin superfamily sugar epimerase
MTAREWIDHLQLLPHPEGGHFREVYRSAEFLAMGCLPTRFTGERALSTAIYFLLEGREVSVLHSIHQDEVWHFYDGSSLTIHVIDPAGQYSPKKLGRDWPQGEEPIVVVPAGCLFGATVNDPSSFALAGCTVAPGFDFADLAMPQREELCRRWPQHRQIIERLTR